LAKAERNAALQDPFFEQRQTKIGQLAMENGFLERALGRLDSPNAKR